MKIQYQSWFCGIWYSYLCFILYDTCGEVLTEALTLKATQYCDQGRRAYTGVYPFAQ